jgi:hypothetical protein
MKYSDEMGSDAVIYIPNIRICSGFRKLIRGRDTQTA